MIFEFIRSAEGGVEFTSHAFISFFQIILIGLASGVLAASLLNWLIKSELIPHYLLNVFTLALVLALFTFSEILASPHSCPSLALPCVFQWHFFLCKLEFSHTALKFSMLVSNSSACLPMKNKQFELRESCFE